MYKQYENNVYKKILIIIVVAVVVTYSTPIAMGLWNERLHIQVEVKVAELTHPKSKGFWSSQIEGILNERPSTRFTLNELDNMIITISNNSDVFDFSVNDSNTRLREALDVLEAPYLGSQDALEAQLLALWFNYVSGYSEGHILSYGGEDYSALDIISLAETAIVAGDEASYEFLKGLCEAYNTAWEE
ncbi:MAG: hypothetical protein F7B20_01330 [Aeropyrum sp.]|nr:hypothetical protein [Aeropyrum sp.]